MKTPRRYTEEEALAKIGEALMNATKTIRPMLERVSEVPFDDAFEDILFDPRLMQYAAAIYTYFLTYGGFSRPQTEEERMSTTIKITVFLHQFKQDILTKLGMEE